MASATTFDRAEPFALDSEAIDRLRSWIRSAIPGVQTEFLRETLEHLERLFGTSRALMIWEESDEPWVNVSYVREGDLVWKQSPPATFDPIVSERFQGISFWVGDAKSAGEHDPIHPALRSELSIGSALSLVLSGGDLQGRLFLVGIDPDPRFFLLGELATAIIESRFAGRSSPPRLEPLEVDRRIAKIARDLHDGLLQSFTGVVLELENLTSRIESDPEDAKRKITQLEGLLMNEQRELRSYLESLREKKRGPEVDFDMTLRLRDLAHRYRDQWGVEVEYQRDALDPVVRKALGWETYRIITEAITNATRHGHARHVLVTLSTHDERLVIVVEDDGEGFPFRGRMSDEELVEKGLAPSSLTGRIHSLNGRISIESTDEGSRLEVSIPIGWRQT